MRSTSKGYATTLRKPESSSGARAARDNSSVCRSLQINGAPERSTRPMTLESSWLLSAMEKVICCAAWLSMLPDHAVVMHPGPMVRGMEISPAVADSPASTILAQVSNGVHVRMAVLYHLRAGAPE